MMIITPNKLQKQKKRRMLLEQWNINDNKTKTWPNQVITLPNRSKTRKEYFIGPMCVTY